MGKVTGVTALLDKKFIVYPFTEEWKRTFGYPERNFTSLIYGESGNGKTDFTVKWVKYLSQFGSVDYYSFEEGLSATIQEAFSRNEMRDVAGKVMLCHEFSLDEMMERLGAKGNKTKFVVIDSRDYLGLTRSQYITLVERFPKKAFIVVCWSEAGKPKGKYAKDILYMVDIKIKVENYKAIPRCRFGGNAVFDFYTGDRVVVNAKSNKEQPEKPSVWDTMEDTIDRGNSSYSLVLIKMHNNEVVAAYMDIDTGETLIASKRHFHRELALSDLRIQLSEYV